MAYAFLDSIIKNYQNNLNKFWLVCIFNIILFTSPPSLVWCRRMSLTASSLRSRMLLMSLRLRRISYFAEVDIVLAAAEVEARSHTDEERLVELVARSVADILSFFRTMPPILGKVKVENLSKIKFFFRLIAFHSEHEIFFTSRQQFGRIAMHSDPE